MATPPYCPYVVGSDAPAPASAFAVPKPSWRQNHDEPAHANNDDGVISDITEWDRSFRALWLSVPGCHGRCAEAALQRAFACCERRSTLSVYTVDDSVRK